MAEHPFKGQHAGLSTDSPLPQDYRTDSHYFGENQHPPLHMNPQKQPSYTEDHSLYYDFDQDYTTSSYPLDFDPKHLSIIINIITSINTTNGEDHKIDLGSPHLRPIFRSILPLTVVLLMYSVLILVGFLGNVILVCVIIKRRLYKDPIQSCVLSIGLAAILQVTVVLPLSLFVLVVHNWILGSFFCYTLPMLQDLPSHVMMLSLLSLSVDRHQQLVRPSWFRLPMHWILPLVWVLSVALVLPYMAYITHLNLDGMGSPFRGGELCVVNLQGNVARYMRALFVVCFLVPVLACLFLMVRVWLCLGVLQSELRGASLSDSVREEITPDREGWDKNNRKVSARSLHSDMESHSQPNRPTSLVTDASSKDLLSDLDLNKEKRAQKFLLLILVSHFLCVLPINVLKMARHLIAETYENDSHFDITYIIFVWITFLPTVVLPWFYVQWVLIGRLCKEGIIGLVKFGSPRNQTEVMRKQRIKEQQQLFADTEVLVSPGYTRDTMDMFLPETETTLSDLDKQIKIRRESLVKMNEKKIDKNGGSVKEVNVLETVLMRRASVIGGDPIAAQACLKAVGPGLTVPVPGDHRRMSYAPTHYGRKDSKSLRVSPLCNRRLSVQHPALVQNPALIA